MCDKREFDVLPFHKQNWVDAFTAKLNSVLKGKPKDARVLMLNSMERYTAVVNGLDFVCYVYTDHVKKKKVVHYMRKVFEKEVPYSA